ncbi:hypothetical protein A9Q99_15285 [Gammaproteobacteria bacterium 45_16_T64]|nr:hypothetical protein A9Q99_15285 [Gammaproteobacteria bacterium 45_16_T64]
MNRFDRVVAIFIQLQTKRIVKAQEIAEHFDVSLRTIYRDIRSLEAAGVPIGSEAGLGYYLDRGYSLPPVHFSQQEALSLLIGEKVMGGLNDSNTQKTYREALHKIKAVLNDDDKDRLAQLSDSIEVHLTARLPNQPEVHDTLQQLQASILSSTVVAIAYRSNLRSEDTERHVEPIGLYYYSHHWHLIAWCQMRQGYRDFRLDRIQHLQLTEQRFNRNRRESLQSYLQKSHQTDQYHEVCLLVSPIIANVIQSQKHYYGFISEEPADEQGNISMVFLTPSLEYMARWLMMFTDGVTIQSPPALISEIQQHAQTLSQHLLT